MRKNILLLSCSMVIGVLICELFVRTYFYKPVTSTEKRKKWAVVPERVWTEYHPTLGWYHQKNKTAKLKKDSIDVTIHTNDDGLRGVKNYSIQRPENTLRIVTLGDSFSFGFGVEDNETFSSYLEQSNSNWEVLNLGVAAYGIDQISLSWDLIGKKYNPQYVLVCIFPDDFWRATRAYVDTGHAKPFYQLVDQKLILKNVPVPQNIQFDDVQFPQTVKRSNLDKFLSHSFIYCYVKRALIRLAKNLNLIDPETSHDWMLSRAILSQLTRTIKQANAEPILIIIPPEYWMKRKRLEAIHRSILRYSKREKIKTLDLTLSFVSAVNESSLERYYIKNDWHWTPAGHKLAAQLIQNFLEKDFRERS